LRGASSQKVPKNPKIYCIHSNLPKSAKIRFGFLGPLGVKEYDLKKFKSLHVHIFLQQKPKNKVKKEDSL
jgi:hypothetical protein